jgi:hypothetical protein
MMEKIDLKKKYKHLYLPSSKQVSVVEVPEFQFAMIDGQVDAGEGPSTSQEYQDALGALYGISYTLKFMSKQRVENPIDCTVMALEGLWWIESGEFDFNTEVPWMFTSMMMQPKHITLDMYQDALEKVAAKRPNPALSKLRFETYTEGLCMQIMHIGPYSDEPRTLALMHAFAKQNGYIISGKHHEIYIGDPRRAKPEKLKTVLRYPIAKIPA